MMLAGEEVEVMTGFCPVVVVVARLAIESADFPRAEGGELPRERMTGN